MDFAVRWFRRVTGRKKGRMTALTLFQGVSGGLGVLCVLLLRNIVDSGGAFRHNTVPIIAPAVPQISLSAVVRWLQVLARAGYRKPLQAAPDGQHSAEGIHPLLRNPYGGVAEPSHQ